MAFGIVLLTSGMSSIADDKIIFLGKKAIKVEIESFDFPFYLGPVKE